MEDNPADANLVHKALEEHGIDGNLLVVSDGETALFLIDEIERHAPQCPDLAIVDLNLPRIPGRDVLEHMRRAERCSTVPVVVLSSSDAPQDRADATRLGASRYIRKPSNLEEFLNLGAHFRSMLTRMR